MLQRCSSQITRQVLTRPSSPELTVNITQRIENGYTVSTTSPGSQSESGTCFTDSKSKYLNYSDNNRMNINNTKSTVNSVLDSVGDWEQLDHYLEAVQRKLRGGWSVHLAKEGRLYYCNQLTESSSWLPSYEDWIRCEDLPYGWERAVDSKGRSYYINHLNKTSTYEAPECIKWENPPEPRTVTLQRNASLGFGFVAGSERPVIVRFVTEGGPSVNKLLPGDHILTVNCEDVREAPRDHVIQLVRACTTEVDLLVCQPAHNLVPGRKSTLLSAGKRAKLRTRPSRVRFAESVCVNGSPLFPASAFSLGDICVPPMANVLKVFLENGQTKSFKYDATTTVRDVVTSLLDKLCLSAHEMFSLVLEHVKSLKRNKLTLLDPDESVARIAARPGAHKLRCLFRVTFVPIQSSSLAQRDLNALDYLFMQCCNDVTQERFAPELQPEVALRLAALHMHQHAIANNISPNKLSVKVVEREFGLERFVPASLFDMKRKELRRLVSHFLKLNVEMTGSSSKVLTALQAKLHYLDIIASLPSYGAKCFSTNQREGVERVLLVSPKFGLSQIPNVRNSVPQQISAIEHFTHVIVNREDDVTCSVTIYIIDDRVVRFFMEDRDACEFSLVLAGYYLLLTGKELCVERDHEQVDEDNPPSYLSQHIVLPAAWSYLLPYHDRSHSVNFLTPPQFHPVELSINDHTNHDLIKQCSPQSECDRNMNSANVVNSNHTKSKAMSFANDASMDLDIHSVIATELLEEAKDSERFVNQIESTAKNNALIEAKNEEVMSRLYEMQKMVENSEQYLSEQNEFMSLNDIRCNSAETQYTLGTDVWFMDKIISTKSDNVSTGSRILPQFDNDCDSLNSSKVSSVEGTPQSGILRHSDSLSLLAETINHDLSGITEGLNSIEGIKLLTSHLGVISSPQPERKINGLNLLLDNLQIMGNDISLSESDSESVNSPTDSLIQRMPSQYLSGSGTENRKNSLTNRSSFGLHSPDGNNFGQETKDYNLKEYLKQLKEVSNVSSVNTQDTDFAAKKLSEIYGFEIREDTFIEIDSDLIDLRSIPPPKTPDELDALSILNAAPQGFGDNIETGNSPEVKADLDKYLENIVVGPPAQRSTPSKELTPEEIMSFIIPPPPNIDKTEIIHAVKDKTPESLYSNSLTNFINSEQHMTESSRVDRKWKFACCPKSGKKETNIDDIMNSTIDQFSKEIESNLKLPPRNCTRTMLPPVRPPKSTELLQRCCQKKHISKEPNNADSFNKSVNEGRPPMIPPRTSTSHKKSEICLSEQRVSLAPRKPQYVISSRPVNNTIGTEPTLPLPLSQINGISMRKAQQTIKYSPSAPKNNICQTTNIYPARSMHSNSHKSHNSKYPEICNTPSTKPLIVKNGHIINVEDLLGKTDTAMAGLLVKLDQVAALCSAAQSAGGGKSIDDEKFQRARKELTEQALVLVTATKYLVVAMSDTTLITLPEHLTSCLTSIRRITELTQDITRHTSSPLQTRNIVLKVHDVASNFRELVSVQVGPQGAGQLALQAECLANVLATLLRSLRIFSP